MSVRVVSLGDCDFVSHGHDSCQLEKVSKELNHGDLIDHNRQKLHGGRATFDPDRPLARRF